MRTLQGVFLHLCCLTLVAAMETSVPNTAFKFLLATGIDRTLENPKLSYLGDVELIDLRTGTSCPRFAVGTLL